MSVSALKMPRSAQETRRLIISAIGWVLCGAGLVLVLAPLVDIVVVVGWRGIAAFSPHLFTENTTGANGGLYNAIEGTLVITLFAMLIALPLGVGAGIHLSEYGKDKLASAIRFMSDTLTGTPSIVLGYFSYIVMIIGFGWGFSLIAASITLAIMIVPYLARITELSLQQVPNSMREAAYALGAKDSNVVFKVVLPAASSGVLTGALLALAISVGETAPLIYTAGWSNYSWSGQFTHEPMAYLTYVIWTFIDQPDAKSHALAFAAAFLVMLVVLVINIGVRVAIRRKKFA
ncbi:phosphate ABC transporter permease PstA [Acidocella aminolytica]|uniref:Phosphate transport system permease protein PstA n=1 Tax=Acidocella aminolytica 101 = DSM 11237 TaxID=1120923 RepID=A0A0D6PKV0_9PROT|nr:phosphate ABC transporter permease PstA [Acidocella aminolytica]GAN81374.1 ABC transporter phosphate permease PstA [Acidocella aminolytica 101 = DSM 11237]SHF43204.1 phosphate ABC transporter membrane protein 2, PhoT family [Acidocella aminolytica 101 = DSM 11237]